MKTTTVKKATIRELLTNLKQIKADLKVIEDAISDERGADLNNLFAGGGDPVGMVIDGGPFCGHDTSVQDYPTDGFGRVGLYLDACLTAVGGMDQEIGIPTEAPTQNFGWISALPDARDYGVAGAPGSDPDELFELIQSIANGEGELAVAAGLKTDFFSPVKHQGHLGSCTAHAGVALIEYLLAVAYESSEAFEFSRLFLYKKARELMGVTGDSGADLRSTMAAMCRFGVPLESSWPYVSANVDAEPIDLVYDKAGKSQSTKYFRIDELGLSADALLRRIKRFLAAGIPMMFGFTIYESYLTMDKSTGLYPYPEDGERVLGGHAAVAVGYDDEKNALRIRNSFGPGFGEDGYCWLPYDYVLKGDAVQWFALLDHAWMDPLRKLYAWAD